MNKHKIMFGFLGAGAVLALPLLVSGQAPQYPADRPALVAEDAWVPLSAGLGFVLTDETVQPGSGSNLMIIKPATGYFMARINGVWRRVNIEQPARVMPAR